MPYPPDVERWRPLVAKYFQPEDVDKALFTIMGESGGNPGAVGDGGHSIGLFQLHDGGVGSGMGESRYDPEANIRASAAAVYGGSGWSPWGEGTEGTSSQFGALGANPYPGGGIDSGDYRMVQAGGGLTGWVQERLGALPLQPGQPVGASGAAALLAQIQEDIERIRTDPSLDEAEKAFFLESLYKQQIDLLGMLDGEAGGAGSFDPNEAWRVQNEYAKTLNDIAVGRYGLETGRYQTENERRQAEFTNEITRLTTEMAQGNLTLQQAKDDLDRWVSAREVADDEAADIEAALQEASKYGTSIDPKTGLPKTAFTGGDLGAGVTQLARLAGIQNPESTVLVNYPGARMVDLAALQRQQQQALGVAGPPPAVPQLGATTGLRPVPEAPGLASSFGVPVPQFQSPPPPGAQAPPPLQSAGQPLTSADEVLRQGGLRNAPPGALAAIGGVQQFGGNVFAGGGASPPSGPQVVVNQETGMKATWRWNPETGQWEPLVTR